MVSGIQVQLNLVDVMDSIIYTTITGYYSTLNKLGYFKYEDVFRILVLCFFRNFVYNDYRGLLSKEDYLEIEKALDCLYGTNCLIPYPDYLKMGKLHLGETTELASRLKALENEKVLKAGDLREQLSNSDIIIVSESDDE